MILDLLNNMVETEDFLNKLERESPKVEREKNLETEKEQEINPELKAAAIKERADFLVKEVKTNKQAIKNIIIHSQQVLQAIKQIRNLLQLPDPNDDQSIPSIKMDKKYIEGLKQQIAEHINELHNLKPDLISAYTYLIKQHYGDGLSSEQARQQAELLVDKLIEEVNGH